MVTLMVALFEGNDVQMILGWILTGLEILLIIIKFLQIVVPKDSKFGKFLARLLPGIHFLSKEVKNLKDGKKDEDQNCEKEENNRHEDHS